MRVVLVRHGETEHNREQRFQARSDVPLNENGINQATAMADGMVAARWAKVYSSDLVRATQTARIVGARLGLPTAVIPAFTERSLGRLDGQLQADHLRAHPDDSRRLRFDFDFAPDGGETRREVFARSVAGVAILVRELSAIGADRNVLVVTHGGLVDVVVQQLLPDVAPSGLLHNCRAVAISAKLRSSGEMTMGVCLLDVSPAECEGSWPQPGHLETIPSTIPQGVNSV